MNKHKIGTKEWAVTRAAERVRDALAQADKGGYGHTGSAWASYISRQDVEAVLDSQESLQGRVDVLSDELAHWRSVAQDRRVAA